MDRRLFGQILQRAVDCKMIMNDALHRCGHQKILLGQAEQLSFGVVVRRIQHLGDDLRIVALLQRLCILPLREQPHIEVLNIPRTPQAQTADRLAVRTGNHHVIGHRFVFLAALIANVAVSVLAPVFDYATAEMHLVDTVGPRNQPDLAARQPDIRHFHLHSVHNHLTEQTVLIAKRKSHCGIVERGQRIHKAGGKATESPVSESRVRLAFIKIVQLKPQIRQRLFVSARKTQIVQIRLERPPEQEFHAHIVHALSACGVDHFFVSGPFFAQQVPHGDCRRLVHLVARRFRRSATEMALEDSLDLFFYFICIRVKIHFSIDLSVTAPHERMIGCFLRLVVISAGRNLSPLIRRLRRHLPPQRGRLLCKHLSFSHKISTY